MILIKIIWGILLTASGLLSLFCGIMTLLGIINIVVVIGLNALGANYPVALPYNTPFSEYFLYVLGSLAFPFVFFALPKIGEAFVDCLPRKSHWLIFENRFLIYAVVSLAAGIGLAYWWWK